MFSKHQGRPSHSSLRSLSSAFLVTPSKRSPRIAATASEIQATTADSYEGLLLQPKQTSGLLHGVFTDHEKVGSKNGDETEVCALERADVMGGAFEYRITLGKEGLGEWVTRLIFGRAKSRQILSRLLNQGLLPETRSWRVS